MPQSEFDVAAFAAAMDAERQARGLSWRQVAAEIWHMSAELNARRNDHPISPSTLTGMARRGDCTCQHALFMLRWLGRAPEDFLASRREDAAIVPLPRVGPDKRLRWNLRALAAALDTHRRARDLTWVEAARELRCSPSQLTGIKTARYAISLRLAMRIVGWLGQPAAAFVYAADW